MKEKRGLNLQGKWRHVTYRDCTSNNGIPFKLDFPAVAGLEARACHPRLREVEADQTFKASRSNRRPSLQTTRGTSDM